MVMLSAVEKQWLGRIVDFHLIRIRADSNTHDRSYPKSGFLPEHTIHFGGRSYT